MLPPNKAIVLVCLSQTRSFSIGALLSSILFVTLITSCEKKLEKNEYARFVRSYDNGLHVKTIAGDFEFDVQFEPDEYVKLLRGGNKFVNDVGEEQTDSLQYYILNIRVASSPAVDIIKYKASSDVELQQRSYYYAYLFQQDIMLEECGTQLPCVLFHFERQSDIKDARTFILGFEQCEVSSREARLVINSPLLGSLPVKIKISKENIPSLKYD